MKRDNILMVESPDTKATIDFLSEGVSVEVTVAGGKVEVKARMSHGENASTWDEHEVTWDIPKKDGE